MKTKQVVIHSSILLNLLCFCGSNIKGQQETRTLYQLQNSQLVTVRGIVKSPNVITDGPEKGKILPDACVFELKLKVGERAIEARPVAGGAVRFVSPTACEAEMEVGEPPESALPPYRAGGSQGSSAPESKLKRMTLAATPGTSAGYMQGYFYDPLYLWVNSEQMDISWNWFSPLSCSSLNSYVRSVPASFPGWYNTANYVSPISSCVYVPPVGIAVSMSGGYIYSSWQNNVFPACFGGSVYAYYNQLYAYGDAFGNLTGNFSWSLTGPPCIYLLNASYNLVRTYN